jgi:hypothetical protein
MDTGHTRLDHACRHRLVSVEQQKAVPGSRKSIHDVFWVWNLKQVAVFQMATSAAMVCLQDHTNGIDD